MTRDSAGIERWLEGLLELIERSQHEWEASGRARSGVLEYASRGHMPTTETDEAIRESIPGFLRIAQEISPSIAGNIQMPTAPSRWPWQDLQQKARMVLGAARQSGTIDEMLGPRGPVVEVTEMHRELSGTASRLFDQGHYRDAVLRAARTVNEMTRDKLEVNGIDGAALVQQAWSLNDPEPAQPRLRVPGVARNTDERMWRDLHQGALHFGTGLYMRVRNVVEHGGDELEAPIAAEFLGAFSAYARWIDDADVDRIS